MHPDICPACGGSSTELFHEVRNVPVNSCILVPSREEAVGFGRGDLRLAFCSGCGFIWNTAFDRALAEYSGRYEETQGYSPRFVAFARDLAQDWIDRHGLRDRTVLEIGCGKGEFLQMLCEIGPNDGIGIDPSYHPDRLVGEATARMRFIQDFYSEAYSDLSADAVVCRHTLEHIPHVEEFVRSVRRALGDRHSTVVLFELPDVYRVLEEIAFWDIYYEHCSYFTLGSLTRLFRRAGFEPVRLSVEFDDQYLILEAFPTDSPSSAYLAGEDDLEATGKAVRRFAQEYPATINRWKSELHELSSAGRKVVIWGAGSKGVSYLTTLGVVDEIPYAVDVNPHKHGMFMAGTGQEIVSPDFLRSYQPDDVVVMNPIYVDEITAMLRDLGLDPEVRAV